jgi:hypothetical protein
VPWTTVNGGAKLCVYLTTGHDTNATSVPPPLYADMTTPPSRALAERLTPSTPAAIRRLLFCDVRNAHAPVLETLALPRLAESLTWLPFDDFARHARLPRYSTYAALVLRVNVLERYGRVLRDAVATDSPVVAALSFYVHAWLDAHMLAAVALARAGRPPVNGSAFLEALLDAYEPSAMTNFHEGELPALVHVIESCSFFENVSLSTQTTDGDTDDAEENVDEAPMLLDDIQMLFNKTIPRRCGVRNVMTNIEQACARSDAFMCFLQSIVAASLLGVYRHSRARPALEERLRLYAAFFFAPPPPLAAELARVRDCEHVTFPLPRTADDAIADSIGDATDNSLTAVRRRQFYAFVTTRIVSAPSSVGKKKKREVTTTTMHQRYVYQDTLVNMVREYMIFVLDRFLPQIGEELCARTSWVRWRLSVIECMDGMRTQLPDAASVLRSVASASLPPKTLYQIERVSFVEALVAAATSFLDAGEASGANDGSERVADAVVTHEVEAVLRHLVSRFPRADVSPVPLLPVSVTPASMDEFEREYLPRGYVPLGAFYLSPAAVREYRAAHRLYATMPASAVATSLVRFLARCCGMYQFSLVHAFAKSQLDRAHIYAIPLADHLARQQAAVLRQRLALPADEPLPLHVLSTFVCSQCRQFRGALITDRAKASDTLPMRGSESVCFQTSCIEQRVVARLRAHGFPSFASLREAAGGGTLFEWYRKNATIDAATDMYPYNPTAFDAPLGATVEAQQWLARATSDAPHFFELSPSLEYDEPEYMPRETNGAVVARALTEPPIVCYADYEEFQRRWEAANERHFLCGHRSANADDETVLWTCGYKGYKNEERKTRQTGAAMQKVSNSITEQERATALRGANQRRRHDMRSYYQLSKCSRTQLLAVSMLGFAVRIDDAIVLACCACLGYTKLAHAHWRGETLLCTRCHLRALAGEQLALDSLGVSSKCRACTVVRKPGMRFRPVTAYDETARVFIEVYLCERHAKKKAWLFDAPIYHSLETIDAGIRGKWGSMRAWDARRDYTQSLFDRDDATDMDDQTLTLARALIGNDAIDDDADDADDTGDVDVVISTSTAHSKRRRVGADARHLSEALV